MKNIFCSVIVILVIALNSFSQICRFDILKDQVIESDLIVIGTLNKTMTKLSTKSENNSIYGRFEIVIERVIAGNIKTNEGLRLKPNDKIPFRELYGSFSQEESRKGIFLLTLDKTGNIESQYFYELTGLAEVNKYLKIHSKTQEAIKILNIPNLDGNSPQPFLTEQTSVNNFCELSIETSNKNELFSISSTFSYFNFIPNLLPFISK